ncbi:unnamed protein product [Ilex paraguariensis]|uniref:Uncharacterized protein n=1 Tax=Ilex paraguariensis TaxID=185542 RepID=A0ABC8TFB8_9AQUA
MGLYDRSRSHSPRHHHNYEEDSHGGATVLVEDVMSEIIATMIRVGDLEAEVQDAREDEAEALGEREQAESETKNETSNINNDSPSNGIEQNGEQSYDLYQEHHQPEHVEYRYTVL